MRNLLENIKKNSQKLLNLTPKDKEKIILKLAQILRENFKIILEANKKDMANFTKSGAMKDRLLLDEKRILALCEGLEKIAYIEDPIGKISKGWKNYAGLNIQKISIPLGLICVIYEARPSLSAEIAALMIKVPMLVYLKAEVKQNLQMRLYLLLLIKYLRNLICKIVLLCLPKEMKSCKF